MKDTEYMDKAEQYFVHTYNRFKVVIDKAEGAYIYDVNGKKYLDFASGIGVCSLGYGNEVYKKALKNQIDKITHTSNLFYNIPSIEAAEKIVKAAGLEKVFFNHEVIAMNHSFHGRTMGSLALTGNEHYQKPFGPMIGGIKFAEYNNLDSVKELVNDKTCAIILEPLQGEGGIYPATK